MRHVWIAVAVFVAVALPPAAVSGGEAEKGPLAPMTACRMIGTTYEILEGFELEPEVLGKAKVLFLDAVKAWDTWKAEVAPKRKELFDKAAAAKKAGDSEGYLKSRKEAYALEKALNDDMGKRLTAILAVLPDDETRIKARAEFLYHNLTTDNWGTAPMFELELSAKQHQALRALCVEAIKAKSDLAIHIRGTANGASKKVAVEALTRVLGPDQAVEAYKKLSARDKRSWPPEKAPKPEAEPMPEIELMPH